MKWWAAASGMSALFLSIAAFVGGAQSALDARSEVGVALGIDADPRGNSAISLAEIDECVSVKTNDTFDIDLWITDVVDLSGWQAQLSYDGSLLAVLVADTQMFQAANPMSRILNLSDPVPDSDGNYFVAATDLVIDASDSGSGVLARVTLQAKGPGTAAVRLARPLLVDRGALPIGDTNGDSYFDGLVHDAEIAIDVPCSTAVASPKATPAAGTTPSSAGDSKATGTPSPRATTAGEAASSPAATTAAEAASSLAANSTATAPPLPTAAHTARTGPSLAPTLAPSQPSVASPGSPFVGHDGVDQSAASSGLSARAFGALVGGAAFVLAAVAGGWYIRRWRPR